VEFINCIILVINGREARMTTILRYVLTQICSIMPRTVLQQVFVVFSNTSDDLQLNFDISQLKSYIDANIVERYICLENPLASIEKAAGAKSQIPKRRLENALGLTLDRACKAMTDLFDSIKELPRVHTNDFMKLYHVKQRVERKTMDMLAEYDHTNQVISKVQKIEKEIQAAAHEKSLYQNFQTTQNLKKRTTQVTKRHNTLCGHPGCYSNCHVSCGLDKSMEKEVFKQCDAMGNGTSENCLVCGHAYHFHYHDEVQWVEEAVVEHLVDQQMKHKFEHAQNTEQQRQILLEAARKKLQELEQKKMDIAWELAGSIKEFEQHAALRPYNKLLIHQIDVIDQAIQAFAEDGKDQEQHKGLRETRDQLQKELVAVTAARASSNLLAQDVQVVPTSSSKL